MNVSKNGSSTQHTGATCTEREANVQTEAVKTLMKERSLNFSEAVDVLILNEQHGHKLNEVLEEPYLPMEMKHQNYVDKSDFSYMPDLLGVY